MFRLRGYHAAKNWHSSRNTVPLFAPALFVPVCRYCYVRGRKGSGYHAAKNWHRPAAP